MPKLRPLALLVLAIVTTSPFLAGQSLLPRQPMDPGPVRAATLPDGWDPGAFVERRLAVKFVDDALVRSTGNGDVTSKASADLSAVRELAAELGLSFSPLILLPEQELADLERRAAQRSRRAQPDLAGMHIVHVPDADIERLETVGQALMDLEKVEFAIIQTLGAPPPGDIAPPTPDLTGNQGYLAANPGVDADYAWSQGLRGAGIRLSDCEYGWNPDHEDLNDIDIHLEPGQTIHPDVYTNGWDSHGTAVVGETSAVDNGYGVTGIAPDADLYTYTEWSVEQGPRRVTAVANAIADSGVGDVVLLEMQDFGVSGFGPAELDATLFNIVKAGTDAGVVVVAAAGNGNQNLDSASYAFYQNMGDSGAIIVGAGTSNASHNKLSFSTYGSRVNVQGWGENVFTLGYGGFAQYGGDKNQRYTSSFSGTSSASPFVAAVCCILQEWAVQSIGQPLEPTVLRQLLVDTGVPQGSGGNIGPFPDLEEAINVLPTLDIDPWEDLGNGKAGLAGIPVLTPSGSLLGNTTYGFDLTDARALSFAFQVFGLTSIFAPFKGGTLVPTPNLVTGPLPVFLDGTISYTATWPTGIPAGLETFWQWWIQDAAAIFGWSASNAVKGTTP